MRFVRYFISSVVVVLLVHPGIASAAPDKLDPSFGEGNGIVRLPSRPPDRVIGEDMAVGPADEIYVLRSSYPTLCPSSCGGGNLFVERLLPDGRPDKSFGMDGASQLLQITGPHGSEPRSALAVAGDGKPVVATTDAGQIVVARFDRSGALDATFGQGGVVRDSFVGVDTGAQLAVGPGRDVVVAAGASSDSGASYLVLVKFRANGSRDQAFGRGGVVVEPTGFAPAGVGLFRDGKIALAGPRCCTLPPTKVVEVGRRLANGFVGRGRRTFSWRKARVGPAASVGDVLALPRGRTEIVGTSLRGGYAARFLADGSLDRSFGRAGIARMSEIDVGAPPPRAAISGSGKLVVVGAFSVPTLFGQEVQLFRRLSNGHRDQSFNLGVPVEVPSMNEALAVGVQSNGRVVVFGENRECVRSCFSTGVLDGFL